MTLTHQVGQYPQTQATEGCINLGLGHPPPPLLPAVQLAEMAGARLGLDPLLLQYGTVRGQLSFRTALADFLSSAGGCAVTADQLLITSGTSSALAIASQMLARPGQKVLCGDPSYFLARGIFEAHGLDAIGVPVDAEGLRCDELARQLGRHPGEVGFVYCMPAFHNPCAVTMSAERRRRILELAEEHDVVLVADEPYNLLAYRCDPPAPLACDDPSGARVLSLGSFSKILAPGIRLGWMMAGEPLLERISRHGALQSGGGLNPVMAGIVEGLIESGFQRQHLDRLREHYTVTSQALTDAVRLHMPEVVFEQPAGGYFAWLDLGPGVSSTALLERARARGVSYTPGPRCAISGDFDRYVRLCFSFYQPDEIARGVQCLAAVMSETAQAAQ